MPRGQGGGRPKIKVDERQLRALAERQWTHSEIAAFFGCHVDTITSRFSVQIAAAKQAGLGQLKDDLWRRARGGVIKEPQPDGSVKVTHTKSSDRLFLHAMNRYHGSVPKDVNATHDGKIEVVITDYRSKKEDKK